MKTTDLPLDKLLEAPWNANNMEPSDLRRLKNSIRRYGLVENLVVRPVGQGEFEVLSGNHRLRVMRDLGYKTVPCVVVNVGDAEAKLLAQALNHIHGEDDPGLRASLLEEILQTTPQEEVLSLLPETARSLEELKSLTPKSLAQHLANFEKSRKARLKHLVVHLTQEQHQVVEKALAERMAAAKVASRQSTNVRGTALYLVCLEFLKGKGEV